MLVQNFSRVLLLSNRKDVINFLEAACGTIIPLTVVTDCTKVPRVAFEIVVLDATAIIGQSAQILHLLECYADKFICLLPFDSPFDLRNYVDRTIKHIISFPISIDRFRLSLLQIQEQLQRELQRESLALTDTEGIPDNLAGYFCGSSYKIKSVRKKIIAASHTKDPVLLLGETGTGKTTGAQLIHTLSSSKNKKMVSYSLSTVVESLAESTFFGHVKGSYTNAECERIGLFEAANGSTLFFDELGLATPNVQAMLLTFLDTGNFKKVGTQKEQHVDVRMIFATNADLSRMLRDGSFRPDLYFRICDNIIQLPPLRERKEDIWDIVNSYLSKEDYRIRPEAFEKLENYSWPGNIRELHKCLRRAMKHAKDGLIVPELIDFGQFSFLQ